MKTAKKNISFIAKFTDEIIECISIEPGYYKCTDEQRYEVLARMQDWITSELVRESDIFEEEPETEPQNLFNLPF